MMAFKKRSAKRAGKRLKTNDINHPSHYNTGDIEVIDAIEDWELGFHLGNSIKYIARAGKKNPKTVITDLEKAKWYLSRKIVRLKHRHLKMK